MGWEIKNDNGKNQCTMKIGDIGEIIIRNRRDDAPAAASAGSRPRRPPDHRCDQPRLLRHRQRGTPTSVKAELEKRGLKPRPDMVGDNFKSFHVKDPDGWDLQISNVTKTTRE